MPKGRPARPDEMKNLALTLGSVAIEAAAPPEEGAPPKNRRFTMEAYDGGPIRQPWSDVPIVVSLDGMDIKAQTLPILIQHNRFTLDAILGQSDSIEVKGSKLIVKGEILGVSDEARQAIELNDRGFKFQASIGATPEVMTFIAEGESLKANGRTFKGPLYFAEKTRLFEVSFVVIGAAQKTSAKIAASLRGEHSMPTFEEYVLALGGDPENIAADTRPMLEAAYKAAYPEPNPDAEKPTKKAPPAKTVEAKGGDGVDLLADFTESAAKEVERVSAIQAMAEEFPNAAKAHPTLVAQAIREKWDVTKAKLEFVLKDRPATPAIHASSGGGETSTDVIEAALCQSLKLKTETLEKRFEAKTLEAAEKRFKGGIGLQQVIFLAAQRNGYVGDGFSAFRSNGELRRVLQAAFSTNEIADVLSNTANKFALQAFMGVEQTWRMLIPGIRNVSDFKTYTSYRLTGDMTYEQLPPTGEIPHAKLGDESYTNRIRTYAKMMGIPREDIINDDLGVLEAFPRMLARGAGLKINEVFWTEWLADASTFYTTARSNYAEGAGTALSNTSLAQAATLFLNQTDSDGKPLSVSPRFLLVPNALHVTAMELLNGLQLGLTSGKPTINVFAGAYELLRSSYLNNSAISGGSATAFYLVADPNDIPVIEVAALNGNIEPTIESAEVDFNQLGIQFRGYNDFGVAKQDYRGAVKLKGAA